MLKPRKLQSRPLRAEWKPTPKSERPQAPIQKLYSTKGNMVSPNYIGQKFGRLLILDRVLDQNKRPQFLCQCDCGTQKLINRSNVTTGKVKSCGCFRAEATAAKNTKHGASKSSTYGRWNSMIGRCTNPNDSAYERYGGRGITVCDRWLKFENFLQDMGFCPHGLSLDRINNNGNYEPDNCRWATLQEQGNNKRNNRIVEWGGRNYTITQLAEARGIPVGRFRGRLAAGCLLEWAVDPKNYAKARHAIPKSKI